MQYLKQNSLKTAKFFEKTILHDKISKVAAKMLLILLIILIVIYEQKQKIIQTSPTENQITRPAETETPIFKNPTILQTTMKNSTPKKKIQKFSTWKTRNYSTQFTAMKNGFREKKRRPPKSEERRF